MLGCTSPQARAERALAKAIGATPKPGTVAVKVGSMLLGTVDLRFDATNPLRADWAVLIDEIADDRYGFAGCIRRADWQRRREMRNDGELYLFVSRFDLEPFKVFLDAMRAETVG